MLARRTSRVVIAVVVGAACAPSSPRPDRVPSITTDASDAAVVDVAPDAAADALAPSTTDGGALHVDAGLSAPSAPTCTTRTAQVGTGACAADAECAIVSLPGVGVGCCPRCGQLGRDDVRAFRADAIPPCSIGCPGCETTFAPGVGAGCRERRCVVLETTCDRGRAPCLPVVPPRLLPRVMPANVARCTKDAECRLNVDDCCSCAMAGASEVSAVRLEARIACTGPGHCPDCVPGGPPPNLRAVCVQNVCRVQATGVDLACAMGR